jgi:hypothetical protein
MNESASDWAPSFDPIQESREFSFYQENCFTSTMRNGIGKFGMVPNNTLAKGDIIRLMPGDIAPALCELIPYDIVSDDHISRIHTT